MELKKFPYPKDKGIKLIEGLKISRPMFLFTSPAPLNGLWRVFKLDYNGRLVVYINDMMFSDSFEAYIDRLSDVLKRISHTGLEISLKKCNNFIFMKENSNS